nr:MAG TPA: hypothetical protein [Caudoviricetes sp.]
MVSTLCVGYLFLTRLLNSKRPDRKLSGLSISDTLAT